MRAKMHTWLAPMLIGPRRNSMYSRPIITLRSGLFTSSFSVGRLER